MLVLPLRVVGDVIEQHNALGQIVLGIALPGAFPVAGHTGEFDAIVFAVARGDTLHHFGLVRAQSGFWGLQPESGWQDVTSAGLQLVIEIEDHWSVLFGRDVAAEQRRQIEGQRPALRDDAEFDQLLRIDGVAHGFAVGEDFVGDRGAVVHRFSSVEGTLAGALHSVGR